MWSASWLSAHSCFVYRLHLKDLGLSGIFVSQATNEILSLLFADNIPLTGDCVICLQRKPDALDMFL